MPATRLETIFIPKPWGRRDLPPEFGAPGTDGEAIGEVWHRAPGGEGAELLVKHLFTSERLSIQVHPDDACARRLGHARGKDEAWLVLGAEPDATIGIGLVRPLSKEELRAAALDGSIEALLDWKPVKTGDVFHIPAGTVHALGPGLFVLEVQQNADITFRLYDYGRPRELHLDEAVAAAHPRPYEAAGASRTIGDGREILISGGSFAVERWRGREAEIGADGDAPVWLIPIGGDCSADGEALAPGEVAMAQGRTNLRVGGDGELLLAYAGARVRESR